MTFKTKAVGLLAGSALAFSLTASALASDATVTLGDNPDPSAGCHASINSGSFDLGTWQWNGDAYVHVDGTGNGGSLGFSVTQDVSADTIPCFVSASGGPLNQVTDGDGNMVTGGATINLAFTVNGSLNQDTVPTSWSGAGGGIAVSMTNLGNQSAGDYEGTVSVTATTSS